MGFRDASNDKLEAKTANTPAPAAQTQDWKVTLNRYSDQFQKLVGNPSDVQRFNRMIFTHVGNQPKLAAIARANPLTLISACLDILEKNLDPSVSNEVYLIPYGNKIAAQVGYKGLQKLAMRAAKNLGFGYTKLGAEEVREYDHFDVKLGSESGIEHALPKFGTERGKVIGYYAIARTTEGREEFLLMTVQELELHFERYCKAKTNPNSPWSDKKNFPAWCLKTVLRLLINRKLPQDSKLSEAINDDAAIEAETSTSEKAELPEPDDGAGAIEAEVTTTEGEH